MNMNKNEMIDLFKKLMKGEVLTIKCLEPEFDLIERGAQFEYNKDTIIVTLWNSMNGIREQKGIIADRGLALCFFKQAVWCAETVEAWDKSNAKTVWVEEELRK